MDPVLRGEFKTGVVEAISSLDAINQLKADHNRIRQLFYRVGEQKNNAGITSLVQAICDELTIYLIIKEEIFYPSLRHAFPNAPAHLDESVVEHFSLKVIMETLDGQAPGDPLFTAKVRALKRHFNHHVDYEERCLFPETRQVNLTNIGKRIRERRRQLTEELS